MGQVNGRHHLQEVLQTAADGVSDIIGFQVAVISCMCPDGTLEVVAVSGDDRARDQLMGHHTPVEDIEAEFAMADEWGILRFVPHERLPEELLPAGWVPDVEPLQVPNAWHPLDALFAPLSSPAGELVGLLSVDLPHDGLRPDQFQREILEMYAVQAGIAINNAQHRNRLAEQVRLATAVRTVMDTAGRGLDLGHVIDDSVTPVVDGFRCHAMWIRAFEGQGERPGRGRGAVYLSDTGVVASDHVMALAARAARQCWARQRAMVVSERGAHPADLISTDDARDLFNFIALTGGRSLLFVPMGAGGECVGYVSLARAETDGRWSEEEAYAAWEIGRELGRAVLHARLFEREQAVVAELQDLDRYKTDLISTISHELKNPLTSILGHVEMLEPDTAGSVNGASLAAIGRSAERLDALVGDLLLLSKVGDPNRRFQPAPVDISGLLDEVVEMLRIHAKQRGVSLSAPDGDAQVMAWGNRTELDRALTNIVSNAIKFTAENGTVTLSLSATDDVVVFECRDEGLGISEADQERLFTEFYRSSNPAALAIPGTGLGLTIVKRIVDRHQAAISVQSEIGVGSTFTITLPRPPAADGGREPVS